ncbi:MAG: M23 family metallopeptidase [Candidatus Gracilibacteria bacterium]
MGKETPQQVPPAIEVTTPPEAVPPSTEAKEAQEVHDTTQDGVMKESRRERVNIIKADQFFDRSGKLKTDFLEENVAFTSIEVLYQIEEKSPGALLEVFSEKTADGVYKFDFKDNTQAESRIGLSWFFKSMPEIRNVNVKYPDGTERVSERKGLVGSFYDGEGYVEVMTGYEVTVTKQATPAELQSLKAEKDQLVSSFEQAKGDPKFSSFFDMLGDKKYRSVDVDKNEKGKNHAEKLAFHVFEVSADNGVDPYLTMSLLKAENGNNERFFGVMAEGCEGFEMQLEMAIRMIRTHEMSYKDVSSKEPSINGVYTVDFLAYFSEIYSPSAINSNHFNNLYKNYFSYKGTSEPAAVNPAEGRRLAGLYMNGGSSKVRNPVSEIQKREVLASGVHLKQLVPANGRLTSPYGVRFHPIDHVWKMHTGLDIDGETGDQVNAWKDGTVSFAGRKGGYGNLVIIKHDDGSQSYYAHLKQIDVKKGQRISGGNPIGLMGSTGKSTGSHLHFEIRINGQAVNPLEKFNN